MRLNHVNLIIGKRGSGKTTYLRRLLKSQTKKVLIIDTIDHEAYRDIKAVTPAQLAAWTRGTIRIYGYDFAEIFEILNTQIFNAFIVFEDCTKYIRDRVPDNVRNFIVDTKQKNIDCIFIYHGYGMIQPDLYRLSDSLTIFKTNENIDEYKRKIPNFGDVKEVNKIVQASKNKFICRSVKTN
jgi:hypothetical protein